MSSLLGRETRRQVDETLRLMGERITLRRITRETYDPATNTTSGSDTNEDQEVFGAFVLRDDQLARLLDNTSGRTPIERETRVAVLSALQVSRAPVDPLPEPTDVLVADMVGGPVRLMNIRVRRLGGIVIGLRADVQD